MRVSKHIHSCVLLEEQGDKILIDPGIFSFIEGGISPSDFQGISAILITHQHDDHVDAEALKVILKNNSNATVFSNAGVKKMLAEHGIETTIFEEGERRISNVRVKAVPATHEKVLSPTPPNTAFVVNETFLHPGDSLDKNLLAFKGIEMLALPVTAPWATAVSIVAFANELAPKHVIPIHDAFLKEFFLKRQYVNYRNYFSASGIIFYSLEHPGDTVEY